MTTPTTPNGLTKFDHLTPERAVLAAWTDAGRSPHLHRTEQIRLRRAMPLLARALDRLATERRRLP